MVSVPKVSQVEHTKSNFIFDGIKNYSLFLWSCSAIAQEYECWRSSCYFVRLSLVLPISTVKAKRILNILHLVKITSEPKYSQSQFEFIQSLSENAELCHRVFLTTGLWKFLELHFDGCPVDVCGIAIWGYFFSFNVEWWMNSQFSGCLLSLWNLTTV